ncbi:MAG: hypothetical protein HKN82_00130 [Akkermansiaceae bacterium]|nr:hypothetical protein [Akkermansiaceae bacterium]NNM29808.1 hypothetical protein [Akkermansiaceae bacterium]
MPDPDPTGPATAARVPPALPPPPTVEGISDFSDKLSPMLVKELRQGLRTYTFVILFLFLQGLLALVVLTASGATANTSGSDTAGTVVSQIVFCVYALAVLVVQPLRGISALATEIKQNTIDLLVLTRLSAWRIVWGKWSAIVSQSGLLLVAILPYLILRYFFGGMQLFSEMFLMLYLFLLSGVLTAFTVGLSGAGSPLIRGLVVVGGAPALALAIMFGFTPEFPRIVGYFNVASAANVGILAGILALAVYLGYFFLEVGTGAIAPISENRATLKRLIGLAVVVVTYGTLQIADDGLALLATLVVAALISLDLFTERAEFPAVVCRPFLRFGRPGRLAGRFLYPGWATGSLFFLLLVAVTCGMLLLRQATTGLRAEHFTYAGIGFAVMVFPAAMMQLCARNRPERFTMYISITIMGWLLALILGILYGEVRNELLLWLFSPVPMVLFPLSNELTSPTNRVTISFIAWALAGLYTLIVLVGAGRSLAALAKLERAE